MPHLQPAATSCSPRALTSAAIPRACHRASHAAAATASPACHTWRRHDPVCPPPPPPPPPHRCLPAAAAQVHSVVSKMMMEENLVGSWDQPTRTVVMHNAQPSRLQTLASDLSDRAAGGLSPQSLIRLTSVLQMARRSCPVITSEGRSLGRSYQACVGLCPVLASIPGVCKGAWTAQLPCVSGQVVTAAISTRGQLSECRFLSAAF